MSAEKPSEQEMRREYDEWAMRQTGSVAAPKTSKPSRVAHERLVSPQPGEVWQHEHHGAVKIVRKWNEKESVCEIIEQGNRRALLMNCLMKRGG